MWRADREIQLACFQNATIDFNDEFLGHGRHAVTPEQVRFIIVS